MKSAKPVIPMTIFVPTEDDKMPDRDAIDRPVYCCVENTCKLASGVFLRHENPRVPSEDDPRATRRAGAARRDRVQRVGGGRDRASSWRVGARRIGGRRQ